MVRFISKFSNFKQRGFTLIELLIVIIIIAALAVVAFVSLNPVKRLQDARNARRIADVDSIRSAIQAYLVDKGSLPPGLINGMPEMQIGTSNGTGIGVNNPSCVNTTGSCNATPQSCVDLTTPLATYLKTIPQDPQIGSASATGYSVSVDAHNIVTVNACGIEGSSATPTVTTNTTTAINTTTVILNGSVNPNGYATTCWFEYGTTTAYGSQTANDTTPGSATSTVNVIANLSGITAGTTYHARLDCSNSKGQTNGSDTSFTTEPANLLAQKQDLYGSEIGAWETNGKPAVDTTTAIPGEVNAANIPVIRYAVYDCFSDETCGRDNHTGSLSRLTFDSAISGIVNTLHAVPWIKLLPIAKGNIGSVADETFFCPATNNLGMNLPIEKDLMNEIHKVYTGPIIIESSNEAEYDCYSYWGYSSAGAVGVSKTLGDMYNNTMPALVKYTRNTLGFSQVVTVGYVGIGGGTGWGQTCSSNAGYPYGYNCTYSSRWINEFNTEVAAAYATSSADTDYIPNVESIHAYPHSPDFGSNPYTFNDNISFAFYRNWITQSRSQVNSIWGSTIGNNIRFAISEWNAGACTNLTTNCWSGWSTPPTVDSFYSGWLGMLQGDGNTIGTGTRYWAANVFELGSNSATSPDGYYNLINPDGTYPDWYNTFKTTSTTDSNR